MSTCQPGVVGVGVLGRRVDKGGGAVPDPFLASRKPRPTPSANSSIAITTATIVLRGSGRSDEERWFLPSMGTALTMIPRRLDDELQAEAKAEDEDCSTSASTMDGDVTSSALILRGRWLLRMGESSPVSLLSTLPGSLRRPPPLRPTTCWLPIERREDDCRRRHRPLLRPDDPEPTPTTTRALVTKISW